MTKINVSKIVVAGLAGTAVMTLVMLMAPMMGMPPMNIGKMLGSMMGGSVVLGWMAHFVIGTVLALVYAAAFASRLPGPPVARGALFSLIPWLVAQVVVMPMMGAGLFSGSALMATGSNDGPPHLRRDRGRHVRGAVWNNDASGRRVIGAEGD